MRSVLSLFTFVTLAFGVFFAAAAEPSIIPNQEELLRPFGPADLDTFFAPPKIYHPETWFHYIGGNVSFDGITADLEAAAAAGLSGVQLFHGQFGGAWPETKEQIPCLSAKWDAAVKHTAEECRRLGLRFTLQNCPGWAMSGGPWIKPENAMRHLVWSRTDVESDGISAVEAALPKPQPSNEDWRDYRPVAVLAFPTPLENGDAPLTPEKFQSDLPDLPWAECFAGNAGGKISLPPTDEKNPHWVEVTLPSEVTLRTVELPSINSYIHAFCYDPGVTLTIDKVLEDGTREAVSQVELPPASWQDDRPISLACNETRGHKFRFSIVNQHPMKLNSIRLFSAAKVNNWESEAGWTLRGALRTGDAPRQNAETFVDFKTIRNLSDKIDADGNFRAELPAGKWTILRVGHVNTGAKNGPAPPEGTGWECDKLSRSGADVHFAGYIGRLINKGGPLEGGLLGGLLLDSWECRTQTWTDGLDTTFEQRLGYSPILYLPAIFGYVVGDHETSHRFLRDWRGTIGALFADEFYGEMAEQARKHGLSIQYETAAGDIFPADILEYYKYADVPMCEFWQPLSVGFVGSLNFKPIKPAASAARLYGKPRVSAESFTSFHLTWDERWEMLREVFNRNAAEGVTHCVFHTCTHQPQIGFLPPGTSMGTGIGTPFIRNQTWWRQLPAFTDMLARSSFLLERGRPVSDVLWYLGDEIGHKPDQEFPFPDGFKYDYCNPDILLNRLTVKDGELTTPEGLRYRVLWLPETRRMLPETLEKLAELVRSGANVIGEKPEQPATLSGGEETQKRFDAACRELWGEEKPTGVRTLGTGKIVSGLPLSEALKKLGIQPDILALNQADALPYTKRLGSQHRRIDGADWYFICAPEGSPFHGEFSFRDGGPTAEIWDPLSGSAKPIAVRTENGRSILTLDLPVAGACFVVFPKTPIASGEPAGELLTVADKMLAGPWRLTFPAGWGIEEPLQTEQLAAWKDLPLSDEGKAFSGTVHYETTVTIPAEERRDGARLTLDLGRVIQIAEVRLNDRPLGTFWTNPYKIDITDAAQDGENRLEIDVTGTWFNRLVYDANRPEPERKTWTISGPSKESPLRESGLLGPVRLTVEREK